MAIAARNSNRPAQPKAEEGAATFTNVIDLGDRYLVKVFVSPVQLRTLVGREIVAVTDHPQGGGRSIPVYDVDRTGWLDKWFAFEVPKAVNADGSPKVHDLSARAIDADTDSVHIESTQVMVSLTDGVYSIRKIGYGEMIEHFGGTRLKKGADGTFTVAEATAGSL